MISEIFIERPKLAMVISIVIMIGGILCITKVPVAEYPEVTPPQINVSATSRRQRAGDCGYRRRSD